MMITDENDGDIIQLLTRKVFTPGASSFKVNVVGSNENKPDVKHNMKFVGLQQLVDDGTVTSTFPNLNQRESIVSSIRRDTEQFSEEDVFYEASPAVEEKVNDHWALLSHQDSQVKYVPCLIEDSRFVEVMYEPVDATLIPNSEKLDLSQLVPCFEPKSFGPLYDVPEFDETSDPVTTLLCILDMELSGMSKYHDERSYWKRLVLWLRDSESDEELQQRYYRKYPWTKYLTKFES